MLGHSMEPQHSNAADDPPPGRRTRILLESADDHPLNSAESSSVSSAESKNEATSLHRLPPRVELSPAIASMLAALNQEKKPTLYWDKLKVKYASIRKGRQELRDPPNALLLNPDGTMSLGYPIVKDIFEPPAAENAEEPDDLSEYDNSFIVYTPPKKGTEAIREAQPYRVLLYILFALQVAIQCYILSQYHEISLHAVISLVLLSVLIVVGLLAVTKSVPALQSAFTCAAAAHTIYLFVAIPSLAALVQFVGAVAIVAVSLLLSSLSRGDWFSISTT